VRDKATSASNTIVELLEAGDIDGAQFCAMISDLSPTDRAEVIAKLVRELRAAGGGLRC
jgi:hypothetical protein